MKIWTNNTFKGRWPVGTAAVVAAETAEEASKQLNLMLSKEHLEHTVPSDMQEFDISDGHVRILCIGDY